MVKVLSGIEDSAIDVSVAASEAQLNIARGVGSKQKSKLVADSDIPSMSAAVQENISQDELFESLIAESKDEGRQSCQW